MKIMILSDSHSMTKQTLLQFIKNHPASYYIHCGDIYMPYTPLEVDHFYNVRGNNDFVDLPKDLTLDIDHLKFFICHGYWSAFGQSVILLLIFSTLMNPIMNLKRMLPIII